LYKDPKVQIKKKERTNAKRKKKTENLQKKRGEKGKLCFEKIRKAAEKRGQTLRYSGMRESNVELGPYRGGGKM